VKNAPAAAEGEKIAKGRARNIRNIRIGKSVRKNIEKVKGGAKKVGRTLAAPARGGAGGGTSVVGRVSQASSAVSKGAEEIKAKAKRGLKGLISKGAEKLAGAASRVARGAEGVATRMKEDYDVFDCILEYLITEGYADTDESALVIMANMSEEWREEIVEKADNTIRLVYGKGGKGVPIKGGSGNVLREPNVGFAQQGRDFRMATDQAAGRAHLNSEKKKREDRTNSSRYDKALKKGIEKATNRSDREPEEGDDYSNSHEPFANRNARRRRASGK
jgi:hypothetical protein